VKYEKTRFADPLAFKFLKTTVPLLAKENIERDEFWVIVSE